MESNKHIREHLFAESVRQVDERHHYVNEVSAERLSAADVDGCHFAECLQDSAGVRLLNAVLVDTQQILGSTRKAASSKYVLSADDTIAPCLTRSTIPSNMFPSLASSRSAARQWKHWFSLSISSKLAP